MASGVPGRPWRRWASSTSRVSETILESIVVRALLRPPLHKTRSRAVEFAGASLAPARHVKLRSALMPASRVDVGLTREPVAGVRGRELGRWYASTASAAPHYPTPRRP